MKREILISATPHETRVAILEDDILVELMVDRPDAERIVGDIYLGTVQAVLPGIQAAFIDIGTEKAAFLHASDVGPMSDEDEDDEEDDVSRARRERRGIVAPIQDLLEKGQRVLVQVSKEPISTKGPRVTTHISLPGRFLVYMPGSRHLGVSRKIEGREERTRLRAMAKEVVPEGEGGVIIRTVGEELTREIFEREFKTLNSTWHKIQKRSKSSRAPALIHNEAKLTSGLIRDVFTQKVDALIIDSKEVYHEVKQYLMGVDPNLMSRVHLYMDPVPLFDKYGIEDAIREAFQRRVDLPSGGYIIIEPTEALVSIDVNTGRYTGRKDPEKTILRTNVDAAREIARQLRLRDIGGIIVCDFIDMETRSNQDRVLQELRTYLGRDRARTRAFAVSDLGLIEMTRQRVRPSLYQSMTQPCPDCGGSGRVFKPEVVLRRIERSIRRVSVQRSERTVMIRVHPQVAMYLLEDEPEFLRRITKQYNLEVDLRDDPLMRQDEFRLLAGPADSDVTTKYALG
ncbi:MAG TPA: Rne/Rng family ribonuclease [Longimicrobiales bacterium]|nr:Rne/Rng family ribonuclease [Longimicrobiales bacterium]